MDLVGRIVDAAGLIADNPRVFDRVRESLLSRYQTCIEVRLARVDIWTIIVVTRRQVF